MPVWWWDITQLRKQSGVGLDWTGCGNDQGEPSAQCVQDLGPRHCVEDGASDQDRDTQDISECRTHLAFFVSEVRSLLDI